MARWQFLLGPPAPTGGHEHPITQARDRKVTFRLGSQSSSHEASCNLDSTSAAMDHFATRGDLAVDLHVLADFGSGARELFRGRAFSPSTDGDPNAIRSEIVAMDYREVLARRKLWSGDTLTYTATEQADIAWGLITDTQGNTGGNLGIARGTDQTTGRTRSRTYELGDGVRDRIDDLSGLLDGFDWDITPVGASSLRFDLWSPTRDNARGVILEHGAEAPIRAFRREKDPGAYANAIRHTGVDGVAAQVREAVGLAGRAEGRWDGVYGDTTLVTTTALSERADWQVDDAQVLLPTYTLTMRRGWWEGPDHVWPGDTVQVRIKRGHILDDLALRVQEIPVTPLPDGGEDVSLVVGRPRVDPRRRTSRIYRRLRDLERRLGDVTP